MSCPDLPPEPPDWKDDRALAAFVENKLKRDRAHADLQAFLIRTATLEPDKGAQQGAQQTKQHEEHEVREAVARAKEGNFYVLSNLLRLYPVPRPQKLSRKDVQARRDFCNEVLAHADEVFKHLDGNSPGVLAVMGAKDKELRAVTLPNEAWTLIADHLIGMGPNKKGPKKKTAQERRAMNPAHDATDAVPLIKAILETIYLERSAREVSKKAKEIAKRIYGVKKDFDQHLRLSKKDKRRLSEPPHPKRSP